MRASLFSPIRNFVHFVSPNLINGQRFLRFGVKDCLGQAREPHPSLNIGY